MKSLEIWYEYVSKTTSILYNSEQKLDFEIIQERDITEWVYPITVERISWKGIWKELAKYFDFENIKIIFYGRSIDYEILKKSFDDLDVVEMENVIELYTIESSKKVMFSAEDLIEMALEENRKNNSGKCNEYLLKAYEQDKKNATYYLWQLYANKNYEGYNIDKSIEFLKESANHKNAKAQRELGMIYYQGKNVKMNKIEALKWFHCAAEQGDIKAAYNVGLCYISCDGIEENYKEAYKWFIFAAEGGDGDAQFELGIGLVKGYFGKNRKKALYYLFKALEKGIKEAEEYIDFLLGDGENESN